jgi:hypothetical protein
MNRGKRKGETLVELMDGRGFGNRGFKTREFKNDGNGSVPGIATKPALDGLVQSSKL